MYSVVALSDKNSQHVKRYSYDVFGDVTIRGPGAEPRETSLYGNPYMFTGRRYDPETGNYYYRFRYYSPETGRFLQTDPIGYLAGLNLYSYVMNNPLNWLDPFGLSPADMVNAEHELGLHPPYCVAEIEDPWRLPDAEWIVKRGTPLLMEHGAEQLAAKSGVFGQIMKYIRKAYEKMSGYGLYDNGQATKRGFE